MTGVKRTSMVRASLGARTTGKAWGLWTAKMPVANSSEAPLRVTAAPPTFLTVACWVPVVPVKTSSNTIWAGVISNWPTTPRPRTVMSKLLSTRPWASWRKETTASLAAADVGA